MYTEGVSPPKLGALADGLPAVHIREAIGLSQFRRDEHFAGVHDAGRVACQRGNAAARELRRFHRGHIDGGIDGRIGEHSFGGGGAGVERNHSNAMGLEFQRGIGSQFVYCGLAHA